MLRPIFVVPLCVLAVSLLVLLYRAHPALGVCTLGLVFIVGFVRGAREFSSDSTHR